MGFMINGQIIDGKAFAENYYQKLKSDVQKLKEKLNVIPGLAVILVGEDPSSIIYINHKLKKAREIGINLFEFRLPEKVSQKVLIAKLENLNNDHRVHGILLQLPLPAHITTQEVINVIDSEKDVDGFTIKNIGLLNAWQDCLEPCTPKGALILIKSVMGEDLSGKKAVVIGRSAIVGRPMASMLIRESCTVTVLHSKSKDLVEECKTADILISATGNPNMVKSNWIKPGACVIDVGIVRVDGKLYGDVDFKEAVKIAGYITPVPGGVGPMTVACMLSNTIKATCNQKRIVLNNEEKIHERHI
jgi:methylenetetrahydrofolate dehydrogenase (NADP+)/methenyltetrahydrofolate cyclohydrolase